MTSFASAVQNQSARTTNGMRARKSTANACVDLFFKIGASRGKDITKDFAAAYAENSETALRIAAWARDARGGAGERQIFRDIIKFLGMCEPKDAARLMHKAPELGRWDDILEVENLDLRRIAFGMIKKALDAGIKSKYLLEKIDFMSESECQNLLDSYNGRNGVSS